MISFSIKKIDTKVLYTYFKICKISYREANWSEKCGFEKTQSSRFEENP